MDYKFFAPGLPLPPILTEIDKPHKWYLGGQLARSAGGQARVDQYVQDFARGETPEDIFYKQKTFFAQQFAEQQAQQTQGEIQKVAGGYKNPKDVPDVDPQMMGATPPMEPGYDTPPPDTRVSGAVDRLGQARSNAPQLEEPGPPRINNTAMAIAALGAIFNPRQAQELLAQPFIGATVARSEAAQKAQRDYMIAKDQHDAQLDQLKTELQLALGEQAREDRARERFVDQSIRGGERREDIALRKGERAEDRELTLLRDRTADIVATDRLKMQQEFDLYKGNLAAERKANESFLERMDSFYDKDLPTQRHLAKVYPDVYPFKPRDVLTPDEEAKMVRLKIDRENLKQEEMLTRYMPTKQANEVRAANNAHNAAVEALKTAKGDTVDPVFQRQAQVALITARSAKKAFESEKKRWAGLLKDLAESGDDTIEVGGNELSERDLLYQLSTASGKIVEQDTIIREYEQYVPKAGSGQGSAKSSGNASINPHATSTRDAIKAQFPGVTVDDAIVARSVRGGSTPSDHSTGDAIDVRIKDKKRGDAVAALAMKRPGVKYIIWNDRFWKPDGKGWRDEKSAGIKGTGLHRDHVHISFT